MDVRSPSLRSGPDSGPGQLRQQLTALARPGLELRKARNMRGLKASQVARMAGHHGLARLLSDARPDRRRRPRGPQLSPDALLAVLVQARDWPAPGLPAEAQPCLACPLERAREPAQRRADGSPLCWTWNALPSLDSG